MLQLYFSLFNSISMPLPCSPNIHLILIHSYSSFYSILLHLNSQQPIGDSKGSMGEPNDDEQSRAENQFAKQKFNLIYSVHSFINSQFQFQFHHTITLILFFSFYSFMPFLNSNLTTNKINERIKSFSFLNS